MAATAYASSLSSSLSATRPAPSPTPNLPGASTAADDDELAGIPSIFLAGALQELAPRLLAGLASTTPILPTASSSKPPPLPTFLPCTLQTSLSDSIPPTHLLAVVFSSSSTASAPSPPSSGNLIVPIHSLPWSLSSTVLSPLLANQPPLSFGAPTASHRPRSNGKAKEDAIAAPPAASIFASTFDETAPPTTDDDDAAVAWPFDHADDARPAPSPSSTWAIAVSSGLVTSTSSSSSSSSPVTSAPSSPNVDDLPLPGALPPRDQIFDIPFQPLARIYHLPVVQLPFSLPSVEAFATLHAWVYRNGAEDVWENLVNGQRRQKGVGMEDEVTEDAEKRLDRIEVVWETAQMLGMEDVELWEVLHSAHETVAAEIEEEESEDEDEDEEMDE